MNIRAIVTSFPLLRRAWRMLPGPFRLPVILIGVVLYLWRRLTGRDVPGEKTQPTGPSGEAR